MVCQKVSICLFLLGITLVGITNAQRITIPLKKTSEGELLITVKYGLDQCEVNLTPDIRQCTNIIGEKISIHDHCGSQFVSTNSWYQGSNYVAPFQLGDTEADILFTIPNVFSEYKKQQSLCFGLQYTGDTANFSVFDNLVAEQKIKDKVVYFYLNNSNQSSNDENAAAGTLSIGEPIPSLSQGPFVTLNYEFSGDKVYSVNGESSFKTFGTSFPSRNNIFIDVNSPYTSLLSFGFDSLIKNYKERGIKVTSKGSYPNEQTFLDSIDKLEPIAFEFYTEDKLSTFEVSLAPSQYTRKLANGSYLLLLASLDYTSSITIGNIILESYNLGFDYTKERILISKKSESENNNFRGTHIKL